MLFRTSTNRSFLLAWLFLASLLTATSLSGQTSPEVGATLKDFRIEDQNGESRSLSDLVADGPLALVVFRSAGWCAASKEQLTQLQQNAERFRDGNLQIAGLSYDSQDVLQNFAAREKIGFPLLADSKSKLIRKLGLVNTTYPKGTLRHGLARATIVLIDSDRKVIELLRGEAKKLVTAEKLLDVWNAHRETLPQRPSKISEVRVAGNRFVNSDDHPILFQGIAIADPHKIEKDGHWNKAHFRVVKQWGANLVRIPVHPANFRARGAEAYLELLQQAVTWCEELEMHVIIDWHSIGNLKVGKFESDDKNTSMKETLAFWDLISKRYADNPTVAFYEVFNEPARTYQGLGDCTWLLQRSAGRPWR